MAAAMLSRPVAAAAVLVALMCAAVAVQAQNVPAAGGAPVCDQNVDQNVVNACFKTLGEGNSIAKADRIVSKGNVIKVDVNCCGVFGGHPCLCKMKKLWEAKGKTTQNKLQCVKNNAC